MLKYLLKKSNETFSLFASCYHAKIPPKQPPQTELNLSRHTNEERMAQHILFAPLRDILACFEVSYNARLNTAGDLFCLQGVPKVQGVARRKLPLCRLIKDDGVVAADLPVDATFDFGLLSKKL